MIEILNAKDAREIALSSTMRGLDTNLLEKVANAIQDKIEDACANGQYMVWFGYDEMVDLYGDDLEDIATDEIVRVLLFVIKKLSSLGYTVEDDLTRDVKSIDAGMEISW